MTHPRQRRLLLPSLDDNELTASVWRLQECLCLVEKRETRYRVQWYYRLFEETQRGLTRAPTLDAVHGSLLALGELLRHTGAHTYRVQMEKSDETNKPIVDGVHGSLLALGELLCHTGE
jgi:hypothetical protein